MANLSAFIGSKLNCDVYIRCKDLVDGKTITTYFAAHQFLLRCVNKFALLFDEYKANIIHILNELHIKNKQTLGKKFEEYDDCLLITLDYPRKIINALITFLYTGSRDCIEKLENNELFRLGILIESLGDIDKVTNNCDVNYVYDLIYQRFLNGRIIIESKRDILFIVVTITEFYTSHLRHENVKTKIAGRIDYNAITLILTILVKQFSAAGLRIVQKKEIAMSICYYFFEWCNQEKFKLTNSSIVQCTEEEVEQVNDIFLFWQIDAGREICNQNKSEIIDMLMKYKTSDPIIEEQLS